MTYKVVKFHTSKGPEEGCYEVAFSGDDRCLQKLEVHSAVDFGSDALDYVELFGIWYTPRNRSSLNNTPRLGMRNE